MELVASLTQNLDQLVTVYRHLLDAVRREHEALVHAKTDELEEINLTKEKLIEKVRELDLKWQATARELSQQYGLTSEQPRLLELAMHTKGESQLKLEQLHSVLNLLVQRILELNKKNGELVGVALSHISGAVGSMTQILNANPTYKNSGGMNAKNNGAQGRLVKRQV